MGCEHGVPGMGEHGVPKWVSKIPQIGEGRRVVYCVVAGLVGGYRAQGLG